VTRNPSRCSPALLLICLVGMTASNLQLVSAAPPAVTAIVPAGGQRGTEISVKLQGTVDAQTVQVWSDRPGLEVLKRTEKDGLTLRFPPETVPGLAWLGFANAEEGVGPLRPFLVGSLPEITETEPNQSSAEANRLESLPTTINGVLGKAGDVDHFAVELAAGQTVVAWLDSRERLDSPLDGILQVVGPRGFVVAQNDDDHGFDPRVSFRAPTAGRYVLRVFGFPAQPDSSIRFIGGPNYVYRLTVSTGQAVGLVHPVAVTRGQPTSVTPWGWNLSDPAAAFPLTMTTDGVQPLPLEHDPLQRAAVWGTALPVLTEAAEGQGGTLTARPVAVAGVLSKPGERDAWKLPVKKGDRLSIRGIARTIGAPTDLVLRMLDPTGKSLQQVDDAVQDEADVVLEWTAPADGDYGLEVRDRFAHGGPNYGYAIEVAPAAPQVALTVNADAFNVIGEKPTELTVTVTRRGGHNSPVKIEARELPEGVTVAPVVSEPKGATAKEVKLQVTSTRGEPWSGPLQIIGVTDGAAGPAAVAVPSLGNQSSRRPFPLLWVVPKPAAKP
jgi:hypothetical protein